MKNFTILTNHRSEPYFTFVKNGRKTIEARIRKDKYRLVKPGDHIVIYNESETEKLEVLVTNVRTYQTFEELYSNEPLENTMPDVVSVKEALEIVFQRFYTKEQEKRYGVVAIEIRLL